MEAFFALLPICAGNPPVPGEFPAQRPVTRALMFSWICVSINGWENNREAGDSRRYRAHYDVIVNVMADNGDCFRDKITTENLYRLLLLIEATILTKQTILSGDRSSDPRCG